MPNSKQAKKRLRQDEKRKLRNRIVRKLIKTYTKRTLKAAEEGNLDAAEADFRITMARLDRAGIRRVIHPNTVARRKSKLTKQYNTLKAAATA